MSLFTGFAQYAAGVECKTPGISRHVAHLPQHALVKRPEGVNLIPRREVYFIHFIDYVAQQVPERW